MKTVYVETSIVSYLSGKPSRDLLIAACQHATIDWWREKRGLYEIFTSQLVIDESSAGEPELAAKRLSYLEGVPILTLGDDVKKLAKSLVKQGALPKKSEADALHIAVAAVHKIDLLLTWNCRHIDNPTMKPKVRSVCLDEGFICPEICTPIDILEAESNEE